MTPIPFWRKSGALRPNYRSEAKSLFTRFSQRHELSYSVKEDEIDVWWEFPVQDKLSWPVTLMLQNADELSFGVPGFWSYFFPFPSIAEKFQAYIDDWVCGRARMVRHPGLIRLTARTDLEVLADGNWTRVYRSHGDAWPHSTNMIRNS